jgi:dihydroneopterin aldolase
MAITTQLEKKIDTLRITGLKVATRIGVYTWEQHIMQTLVFDLCIPIEVQHAQDNLANVLDYAELCQCITTFVSERSFQLLETAAEQVLQMLQQQFSLQHLTLTVTKLFAVKNAASIQISLER